MRDYKNIKVYQFADNLAVEIYKVTKGGSVGIYGLKFF